MRPNLMKHVAVIAAAGATLLTMTSQAASLNSFVVSPPVGQSFTADAIDGNYRQGLTFNPDGSFSSATYWSATQFLINGTDLSANSTGLGKNYGLYVLYSASGTYETSGSEVTFHYLPESGNSAIYLDQMNDTVVTLPPSANGAYGQGNNGDDLLLGFGRNGSGTSVFDPSLLTCGSNGIRCGSTNLMSMLQLTNSGKSFFMAPTMFYDSFNLSGTLGNFPPAESVTTTGTLTLTFGAANTTPSDVPEPASLALLGLGLAAICIGRRRR